MNIKRNLKEENQIGQERYLLKENNKSFLKLLKPTPTSIIKYHDDFFIYIWRYTELNGTMSHLISEMRYKIPKSENVIPTFINEN